jgi:hypothetical protein
MIMDLERNQKNYNEIRLICLLRSEKNKCSLLKSKCKEDSYNSCPLWRFVSKMQKR